MKKLYKEMEEDILEGDFLELSLIEKIKMYMTRSFYLGLIYTQGENKEDGIKLKDIASLYNVHLSTISKITTGVNYANVGMGLRN